MPVYAKGKKWRVRVWWKGKPREWVLEEGASKADAEAFEARKRVELEVGAERIETRVVPRLSAFIENVYLDHAQVHLAKKTMKDRTYTLATLEAHFGDMRLGDIDKVAVARFQKARLREVSAGSVNDDVKVLLAVLNYAREELGYPIAPLKVKHLPKSGRRRNVTPWTTDEMGRLLLAVRKKSPDILPLVVCIANTGLRKGEALALTWENVDERRKLLRIWPNAEWQPKNRQPREVPYNQTVADLFKQRASKKWVFPCSTGERYATWPQRQFDRARKAAGLVGGPHTLRHTYASHFLDANPDLYLLGQVLGHSHQRVTELYSHLLPTHLERARTAVEFKPPRMLAVVEG